MAFLIYVTFSNASGWGWGSGWDGVAPAQPPTTEAGLKKKLGTS